MRIKFWIDLFYPRFYVIDSIVAAVSALAEGGTATAVGTGVEVGADVGAMDAMGAAVASTVSDGILSGSLGGLMTDMAVGGTMMSGIQSIQTATANQANSKAQMLQANQTLNDQVKIQEGQQAQTQAMASLQNQQTQDQLSLAQQGVKQQQQLNNETNSMNEQSWNRSNQQGPGTSALEAAKQQSLMQGNGSTFLTGAQGPTSTSAPLGKTTLLGS